MGVPGPWYERLPHFRMGFTPSSGKELQAEYFVPRGDAVDAILAIERLRDRVGPHLFISEIRTIGSMSWITVRAAQFPLIASFASRISSARRVTSATARGPAPGRPRSAVEIRSLFMRWRISILSSIFGSWTDGDWSPSRRVSSFRSIVRRAGLFPTSFQS